MASEQKLPSTGDNQPNTPATSSGELKNPTNDERPSCCNSDGHKREPESHPVTGPPEGRREQVEGANDGYGVSTGEWEGVGPKETQKEGEKRAEEVTCENTSHQVTKVEVSENKEEIHVGLLVSVDESDPSQEEGAAQGAQVAGMETEVQGSEKGTGPEMTQQQVTSDGKQVTGEMTAPQETGEGTAPQVTAEGTAPQVTAEGTAPQETGEVTAPQVTAEGTVPQVTAEGTAPQVTAEGTAPQVTAEGTAPQVQVEGTAPQVPVEGTAPQVPVEGAAPQVKDEETLVQVTGDEIEPQVIGEGTAPQVTAEGTAPQVTAEGTAPQVTGKGTAPQVTAEGTAPQVTAEGTAPQVTAEGTAPQVTAEGTASQVTAEGTAPQVTAEGTAPQVTAEGTAPQVTAEGTEPQVTGEGTVEQVIGKKTELKETDEELETQTKVEETCFQSTSEDPSVQAAGEERCPRESVEDPPAEAIVPEISEHLGSEEQRGAQVSGTGVPERAEAQVSGAGERWIDSLVHTIVTEAAGEGAHTGEQGPGAQVSACAEAADTIAVRTEEPGHSTVQVTGTQTMAGEQVTAQAAGAAAAAQVSTDRQVSTDSTDIAAHVSGEEPWLQVRARAETATPEQGDAEATGTDKQVEEAAAFGEDSAAAQVTVTGEEAQEDSSSNVEVGGQVTASGQEADGEVTPDLVALAGREGTLDPDQQAACREKEWPLLICTVSEVRTVTAAQGDTSQGSATQKDASVKTPEMKEREIVEDGHSPTPETPIEREIRLTMEREMSLRQERGISSPIGQQPQLVEVRRKTISVEPVAVPGKERQLAGAQMQREIQLETQREKDLVDLGKVMGTYDRGPQQELQEMKMIFESMKTEPSDAPPFKKKQSEPQQQPRSQEAPPSIIPVSTNHVVPAKVTKKGPSYAEANGSNVIIIEHSSLLRRATPGNTFSSAPADPRRSAPADSRRSAPADSRRSAPADFQRSAPADFQRSAPADFQRSAPADSRRLISAEISYTNSSGPPVVNSAGTPVPSGSPYQLLQSPSPGSLLEREIEEVNERERELQRLRSSIYGRDETDEQTKQKTQEVPSDVQSVYQPERPSWRKLEVNWPPNKEAAMNGQGLDSPRTRRQRSALIQSWERGSPNPKDDE